MFPQLPDFGGTKWHTITPVWIASFLKDEMYWHYAEGRIQALNEKIDQIRRKLEGVMW